MALPVMSISFLVIIYESYFKKSFPLFFDKMHKINQHIFVSTELKLLLPHFSFRSNK